MAQDILDEIAARERETEDAGIRGAYKANEWAQTFSSIPPVEKLRATRNLTDQVARAMQRRLELRAETDQNAQKILYDRQRFADEQAQEPLKMELLRSRINHENSMATATSTREKFRAAAEQAELDDVAGFYTDLEKIKYPKGTPEYRDSVVAAAHAHKRALGLADTRKFIEETLETHQGVSEFLEKNPAPEGYAYGGITRTAGGEVSAKLENMGPGYATVAEGVAEITGSTARDFKQTTKTGKFYYAPRAPRSDDLSTVTDTEIIEGDPDEPTKIRRTTRKVPAAGAGTAPPTAAGDDWLKNQFGE